MRARRGRFRLVHGLLSYPNAGVAAPFGGCQYGVHASATVSTAMFAFFGFTDLVVNAIVVGSTLVASAS